MTPDYITFSNLIIDDIVLSDGRTFMGTLGGSGTHALVGMRIWADRLGFLASVGPDFAPEQRAQLEKLDIDLRGINEYAELQTARAWQIFEPNDKRIEIMRTDFSLYEHFQPTYAKLPADYRQVRGVHLLWEKPLQQIVELIDQLRSANPAMLIVNEPAPDQNQGDAASLGPLLQRLDLFSPDIDQAKSITGLVDPVEMGRLFCQWGARRVAIRMGAQGSLLCTQAGECWRIPAVPPARLIDVTGAGNAYCGGFLVGLGEGTDTLEAALWAAVSASFALEQFGVPDMDAGTRVEAGRRLGWAWENVVALES